MLELRHFRYFIAVAEELHFGRAAERLCMTQPPLSMQIRQLEEDVGVPLFVRGHRPIKLTAAGEVLLEHARAVLSQADSALQKARLTARGEAGHLTIAVTSASVLGLLPRLIAAFKRRYPAVELNVREMVSRDQLAALSQSDINIGLIRPPADHPDIDVQTIHVEPIVVAIPANHPLAERDSIPVSAMNRVPFISFDSRAASYFNRLAHDLLDARGVRPDVVQSATQLHTVVALVSAGLGLALVPQAASRNQFEDVVLRPLDMEPPPMAELCVAWNTQDKNPAVGTFLELAREKWSPAGPSASPEG